MKRLVRRLAAVLDVNDTAGAARLGCCLLVFEGLAVTAAGVWADVRDGTAGVFVTVGLTMAAAGAGASQLPWAKWPRRSIVSLPLIAIVLLGALAWDTPGTAPPYVGLLALWFVFAGIAAPAGASLALLVPSAAAYVSMLGPLSLGHVVRALVAACAGALLGEALTARATSSSGRTAALVQQAETDPLTGLLNRRALEAALAKMSPGDVVVVIDLDHFKLVNDHHGHAHGDRVLVDFGDRLSHVVRASDVVARFGGEEFVLILRHDVGPGARAVAVLGRLRESWQAGHPDVTWSAGIARHGADDDPRDTLQRADHALYAAKSAGRDRVVDADAAPETPATRPPRPPRPPRQRTGGSSPAPHATTTSG